MSDNIQSTGSITFVKPYSTELGQHSKLLSKLKPPAQSFPLPTFATDDADASKLHVPILRSDRIDSILNNNNVKIIQGDSTNSSAQRNILSVGVDSGAVKDSIIESADDDMEVDSEPTLFIELKHFLPKNLKEQATTICIKHFPNVKRSLIEKIIDVLLDQSGSRGKSAFRWTIINNEHIDDKLVYVKFSSIEILKWFVSNASPVLPQLWEGIEVVVDPAANEYIDEKADGNLDLSKESSDISKILKNKRNFETVSKKTGTEDLDEVMQSYSSYKVDSADLVDIPKDMKEKTVSNIIKFRSKVLTIEKDRRKREIEYERRKAKNRLKQIFEGLKEANAASIEDEDTAKPEDDNEDDSDEFPEMTEAEYEKYLAAKDQEAEESKYQEKLNKMKRLEQTEKSSLLEKLSSLQTYENNLIDNKFSYLEEIRNFQDFNFENTISSHEKTERFKLYYKDHSEYLRLRSKERATEEASDKQDEDEELKETKESKVLNKPLSIPVSTSQSGTAPVPEPERKAVTAPEAETKSDAQEKQREAEGKEIEVTASTNIEYADVTIANLPQDKLDLINNKISDLIEEYLGIKETVLIEFIFDFLMTHNLTSKDELIFELEETLDEDSVVVTNELWSYVNEIK